MCCKKSVLKNCHKKTPVFVSLLNKIAGLQAFRCFLVNTEKVLRTNFLKEHLQMAASEGSFLWKKFLSYQNSNRVREKYLCQFLQSCFPFAEVTNNFLVCWNYGFQNSICSSKESIISRGSFATQIFNDESSRKKN